MWPGDSVVKHALAHGIGEAPGLQPGDELARSTNGHVARASGRNATNASTRTGMLQVKHGRREPSLPR